MQATSRKPGTMTHNEKLETNKILWELDGYINRIQRLSVESKNSRVEKALEAIQHCQNLLRWIEQ